MKPQIRSGATIFFVAVFAVFFALVSVLPPGVFAATGINKQINLQGKLVNPTTGINVADGTYNMEFKIYQDGDGVPGGGDETLKWTETRTSGNKVTVTDGVFRVSLGSVTAFGSSVDWNQDTLWVSVNIGGTGTPGWDGEMNPMMRLSATPYALNAGTVSGLTLASGKTFTVNNTITLAGTDSTSFTLPSTSGGTIITSNATSQSISTALTLSATGGNALSLSGAPASAGTSSLLQLGPNAIAVGSANGNYIGINPTSFSGNFFEFEVNGSSKAKLDSTGALTATGVTSTFGAFGTTPAAAGTLRLPNATYITARNQANSADINMIQINSSDLVAFGANLAAFTLGGTVTGNSQNINAIGALTINGGGTITSATSGTLGLGTSSNTTGLTLGNSASTTSIAFDVTTAGNFVLRKNGAAFDCSSQTNGGALSTDSSGNITCTADDGGGGSATLQTAYAAGNTIAITPGTPVNITGTITDTSYVSHINLTLGDDANADSVSGFDIGVTSANTGDLDVINALNLTVTSPDANVKERGITIGTGFDDDIYFASASATLRIQTAGELRITGDNLGGNSNQEYPMFRVKEYFSGAGYGVAESGGFLNLDGSWYEEQFSRQVNPQNADTAPTAKFGDNLMWMFDELGTVVPSISSVTNALYGCTVQQNKVALLSASQSFGLLEIAPETSTNTNTSLSNTAAMGGGCRMHWGLTSSVQAAVLNVANKWIMYWKVKPSAGFTAQDAAAMDQASNKGMWFGADNLTAGWQNTHTVTAASLGGIWMRNANPTNGNLGSLWGGVVRKGSNNGTVACAGMDVKTSAFAMLRIEARSSSDIEFFVDNDLSNGLSMTNCGSITSNIPTQNLGPAINVAQNAIGAKSTIGSPWSVNVDLFAFVQDDPKGVQTELTGIEEESNSSPASPPVDPIAGADLSEYYVVGPDAGLGGGEVMSLDSTMGAAKRSSQSYDRRLLGVAAESTGLTMGESRAGETSPIALTGRVRTQVTGKGGSIRIGDPVTSSDVPGYAMRAINPGKILGTAMENFSCPEGQETCQGKIMVNINVGYYLGDEGDTALLEQRDIMSLDSNSSESGVLASGDTGEVAGTSTESAGLSASESAQISTKRVFNNITEFLKDLLVRAPAYFFENVRFEKLVEFFGNVTFHQKVAFADKVEFSKDTAGYALIKAGERYVDVIFDKEYEYEPVVNANLVIPRVTDEIFQQKVLNGDCTIQDGLDGCQDKIANTLLSGDIKYAVVGKTKQGFLILLNKSTPVDMTFSWQAMAVKDPKTSLRSTGTSSFPDAISVTPTPTTIPFITPTEIPLSPSPTPSIPSPTPTEEPPMP